MKLCLLLLLVALAWRSASAEEQEFSRITLPGMSWMREMITGEEAVHSRKKRFVGLPKGSSMEVRKHLQESAMGPCERVKRKPRRSMRAVQGRAGVLVRS